MADTKKNAKKKNSNKICALKIIFNATYNKTCSDEGLPLETSYLKPGLLTIPNYLASHYSL